MSASSWFPNGLPHFPHMLPRVSRSQWSLHATWAKFVSREARSKGLRQNLQVSMISTGTECCKSIHVTWIRSACARSLFVSLASSLNLNASESELITYKGVHVMNALFSLNGLPHRFSSVFTALVRVICALPQFCAVA